MPELYRLADSTHVNTQADAKHSGQSWEKVNVPTSRRELLDYLNDVAAKVRGGSPQSPPAADTQEVDEEASDTVPVPPPAPIPPQPPAAAPVVTVTAVEEFILDRATVAQVGNIFECLGTRFAELQKKVRD